ncbi:WD40 repeat domain-containing protein, partial [Haemophilus parainfluenzae]|uniref:WD40 repeat domain-containing protein n=1 Tax=Haemophilus parainfluenzae TaxID=729 RepID=UPI001CED55B9
MATYGGTITSLAVSPDGGWLAVGLETGQLQIWDLTGPDSTCLHHDWCVQALAFSPDSASLASGSADETVI